MIKTPTLFILGAGASHPFGYPTGMTLSKNIIDGKFKGNIVSILAGDDSFAKSQYNSKFDAFINKFTGSGYHSIDKFLEKRTEFMEAGKIFIARNLIAFEEDILLRDFKNNWYTYLFNRLNSSFKELGTNNISFITFNYDRSLEYFLFKAIHDSSGKSPGECAKMMENFPIVHLYGQLDPLPWQQPEGKKYSSTECLDQRLMAAPENIKLISDERGAENSEYFKKAYKLISDAECIFFLGFSFDKTNLERLRLDLIKSKKRMYATVYHIEPTERSRIKRYFGQSSYTNSILYADVDALTLLKSHLVVE